MAENPLLPNAELRALHALLSQTVTQQRSLPRAPRGSAKSSINATPQLPSREALLAGTLLQLTAGDLLVPEPEDALMMAMLRETSLARERRFGTLHLPVGAPQLTLALALSQGLQRARLDSLVLVHARAGLAEPAWADTLAAAQQESLPLVVVVADPNGAETFRRLTADPASRQSLTWTTAQRAVTKSRLPILSVDGEDAVAVYRVMQESVLRARAGSGPAMIWAMLPAAADKPSRAKVAAPLARLEHYLQTRQISIDSKRT